jgi:hypothetical protein
MALASEPPSLVFDDFHSMLLERQALKEGLVSPGKWHGLPSKYGDEDYAVLLSKEAARAAVDEDDDGAREDDDEPNLEEDRIRMVRAHFDEFSNVEPWRETLDTLLGYVCLFPQAKLSRQFFTWQGAEELRPRPTKPHRSSSADWEDAHAETRRVLAGPAFEDALTDFVAHPRYLFARYTSEDEDYENPDTRRNYQLAFEPGAVKSWARSFKRELVDVVLSNASPNANDYCSFVDFEALEYAALDFDARTHRRAGHAVPVTEPLRKFVACLGEHADTLISAQLNTKTEFICANRASEVKRSEFAGLADTALVVRANFGEHLKVVPAPRTIAEALEFRDRREIKRLSELIAVWSRAASAGDLALEARIAKDIEKAGRDLKRIAFVRNLAECELGVWIKAIGGQIPFFSTILSASEVGFYYLAKHAELQNCWLSTR